MKIERILILGASGQLGTALQEAFKDMEIFAPRHADLDLLRDSFAEDFAHALDKTHPDLVINCAAMHNVAECERYPKLALKVNHESTRDASEACRLRSIPFAFISTDYVFSGREKEPYHPYDGCDPINAYGVSKYYGELSALVSKKTFIFRTAGLYGPSGISGKGPHFLERVLRAAETGESFRAVDDVFFSPSYTPHVANCIRAIMVDEKYGIHHVVGAECTSWFEFGKYARWYAFQSGLLPAMGELVPAKLAEMNEPFKRPMRVDLASHDHREYRMPLWQKGVEDYVQARFKRIREERFRSA